MKWTIRKSSVLVVVLSVMLFHLSFVNVNIFAQYSGLQQKLVILLLAYILLNIRVIVKNRMSMENVAFLLLAISIMFSSLLNRHYGATPLGILTTWAKVVFPYCVFRIFACKNSLRTSIKALYFCTLIYCVIIDVQVLTTHIEATYETTYLIGNKFNVTYLHLFLVIFYYYLNLDMINDERRINREKIIFFLQIVISVCIAIKVICMTAVMALAILLCFYIFREKVIPALYKPAPALISIGIADTILIFNASVLNIPVVNYFITEILGRDADLTGRLGIFANIFNVVTKRPLFGFGRENNYYVSMMYASAPNLQNGLFDHIISYGIIGTVIMLCLIVLSLRGTKHLSSYPFIILLYIWIFLSSVEVTFNTYLYVTIALIVANKEWCEVRHGT